MELECCTFPKRNGFDRKLAVWSHISVIAFQHKANEIAGMVMKKSVIIGLNPMMQSDGKPKKDNHPPIKIWAFWQSHSLIAKLEYVPEFIHKNWSAVKGVNQNLLYVS